MNKTEERAFLLRAVAEGQNVSCKGISCDECPLGKKYFQSKCYMAPLRERAKGRLAVMNKEKERIEVNLTMENNTVRMQVLAMPERLRGEMWREKTYLVLNGMSLRSHEGPKLLRDTVYLWGRDKKSDKLTGSITLPTTEEALVYALKVTQVIDLWNDTEARSLCPETTYTIQGKEFSESTIQAALRAYVG